MLPSLEAVLHWAAQLTGAALAAGIAVTIALAAHAVLFVLLRRFARLSQLASDEVVVDRLRQPARFALVALAIALAAEAQPALSHVWQSVARFIIPALLGWIAFALIKAFASVLESRAELSMDELAARSRRTRVAILSRTAGFVIVFVTIALMLLGIPGVRNVGATLMASAGLAGLAVGAAAQPALKSLIAGIQMALTEPIRLGDLVVIEGESGRIEDIRMSYVVIRTIDERRLIVPTAKFLDTAFQNWTRVSGGLIGHVTIPVRPDQPVAPMRAAFLRLLDAQENWDRRTGAVLVNEVRVDHLELRLTMSARDPAALAALRLSMREAMVGWLQTASPGGLCQLAVPGSSPL